MLVIDASAAVRACASLDGFALLGGEELVAPPLLWSEARSVLHRAVHRGLASRENGLQALICLERSPVRARAHVRLGREAWRIAPVTVALVAVGSTFMAALGSGHGGSELREDLLPLIGGQLSEGLGVRLLDLVRRRGAQQVAVPLDRLVIGQLLSAVVAALVPPVLRRRVLLAVASAEEPVEQSHRFLPDCRWRVRRG